MFKKKKKRKAKEKKIQILHHEQCLPVEDLTPCAPYIHSRESHLENPPGPKSKLSQALSLGSPCPLLSPSPWVPLRAEFGRDGKDLHALPCPRIPLLIPRKSWGWQQISLGMKGMEGEQGGEGEGLVHTSPVKNRQQPHGAGSVPVPTLPKTPV